MRMIDADALTWKAETFEDDEIFFEYISLRAVEEAPTIYPICPHCGNKIDLQEETK